MTGMLDIDRLNYQYKTTCHSEDLLPREQTITIASYADGATIGWSLYIGGRLNLVNCSELLCANSKIVPTLL